MIMIIIIVIMIMIMIMIIVATNTIMTIMIQIMSESAAGRHPRLGKGRMGSALTGSLQILCFLTGTFRKGTNGVGTNGVTANVMYFDGGTFWVLP